ncbi:TIM-barrel domain-containing protein [Sphingobacterium detergens]|uniref:Alpha-glucosidase (Family GH31 glycosyl hydrolase) n=1 Tax=Sphingobacterium detergens TaxID=1145106 RepID=A0A420BLI9_SPHD1|nr:TIM-barrel domain-containing protein [Sphingobacterium detergens]RKE57609.1 alpha-glucosidase (family GH31 glycosyl hydrolase) [Sphingobacterium detergens]
MKISFWSTKAQVSLLVGLASPFIFQTNRVSAMASTVAYYQIEQRSTVSKIIAVQKINPTTVEIVYDNNQRLTLDFYGNHIFRMFQDIHGGIIRDPEAKPDAKILVEQPRKAVDNLEVKDDGSKAIITTKDIIFSIDKQTAQFSILNRNTNKVVVESLKPIAFESKQVSLELKENKDEYFFGGGVQNGRFSHKGKAIAIENQNSWTDGGVASPTPYFWSTNGYGFMWHTFKKGNYAFGTKPKGTVKLTHDTDYLDVFFMINDGTVPLLNDFYQLTGNPILLPKFGLYEGHLNAYNRDFWKEDEKGILFEDGKRYKESQKDNGGTKESLNGEKGNYQFSARAVIDRYKAHDMPLGWILPNDGYGAGYGQTETLDGNINNLKEFGNYARKNGVEIGLWTQSDLHPKDSISALLQRDIVKEVRDAGVRVLKTDVAWVGPGYSFGLNGVADVGHTMPYYGNDARPFIISLDGWAGTQRYAGIWSGDQTGGVWEYIRFHIPTYIGSGLSGQPNITSDMDGIFGGKNFKVNIRDFQWKTWTPMELNMDGWGSNEKYPHALGEPATSINRLYLKLKSQLVPYSYSIAKQAVDGLPIIRAMFLEQANQYTLGKATQYQYLYGPNFLVAPIYQETRVDEKGNDIRNGIYLPDGEWIDYFTGEKYKGGRIINNFDVPIWKLPVFVKNGAIIPVTNPNNNVQEIKKDQRIYEVYPSGNSDFIEYDDDGKTEAYRYGKGVNTKISSQQKDNKVLFTIAPSQGEFEGFEKAKSTEVRFNVTGAPKKVTAKVNKKGVKLQEAHSLAEFNGLENAYFYDAQPNLNQFATKGSEFEKVALIKNPMVLVRIGKQDVSSTAIEIQVDGFQFTPADKYLSQTAVLIAPTAKVTDSNTQAYTITPTWEKIANADYYEIAFNDLIYSTIKDNQLLFEGLDAETDYAFKIRAVNKAGASDWSTFAAKTKANPLEFAIEGIKAETSADNQGGNGINKLFNYDEGDMWHTKWGQTAVPFDMTLDLKSVNQLDKFEYLPRTDGGNGIILKGKVFYSNDKDTWTEAGSFDWKRDGEMKQFNFSQHPVARFIKISVTEAVGGFGSGRELYVFKVPGSTSYLPGDINNDRLIDQNDLTSYINYTGLRMGDGDFEGYVSNGDVNKNNLIDAYDISNVAAMIEGGAKPTKEEKVAGKLKLTASKTTLKSGDIVEIAVSGENLKAVNALSFALPYNQGDFEFVGIDPLQLKEMSNYTNDRLHTNGSKALYPTFVNLGNKETLNGSEILFKIKLKAKRNVNFNLKAVDGILVDKKLNSISF